jgi:hypothetical protein
MGDKSQGDSVRYLRQTASLTFGTSAADDDTWLVSQLTWFETTSISTLENVKSQDDRDILCFGYPE